MPRRGEPSADGKGKWSKYGSSGSTEIERQVWIERRRWQQHVVHPARHG
jgi:hypothetical protein